LALVDGDAPAPATYVTGRGAPLVDAANSSERYAHGTRARYAFVRCRCEPCSDANSAYECERLSSRVALKPWKIHFAPGGGHYVVRHRGTGEIAHRVADLRGAQRFRDRLNGRDAPAVPPSDELMPTATAVRHLKALRAAGVGLKAVELRCGVARSVLRRLIGGEIRRTRRSTTERILSVSVSDVRLGAYVSGFATWLFLDALIAGGYRRRWIALQLGRKTPALQIQRARVRASTARDVIRLYATVSANDPRLPRFVGSEGPIATLSVPEWWGAAIQETAS